LECEFHLVQADSRSKPNVPALTPAGFEKWIRTNIFAYPDQEADRLSAVIMQLPIDADGTLVDGKPERLPKQLSRYLLPAIHDEKTRKTLDSAITDFLDDAGAPTPLSSPSVKSPFGPPPRQPRDTAGTSSGKRSSEPSPSSKRRSITAETIATVLPEKYSEPSGERRPSYRRRASSSKGYDRSEVRIEPARAPRPSLDRTTSSRYTYQNLPPPPIGRTSSYRTSVSSAQNGSHGMRSPSVSSANHEQSWSASSSAMLTPSSSFSSTGNHFELSNGRSDRKGSGGGSQDDYSTRYSPRSSRQEIDSTPRAATANTANRRSWVGPTTPAADTGPTFEDLYKKDVSSSKRRSESRGYHR
jgi:hypothetical protein